MSNDLEKSEKPMRTFIAKDQGSIVTFPQS